MSLTAIRLSALYQNLRSNALTPAEIAQAADAARMLSRLVHECEQIAVKFFEELPAGEYEVPAKTFICDDYGMDVTITKVVMEHGCRAQAHTTEGELVDILNDIPNIGDFLKLYDIVKPQVRQ